MKSTKRLSKLFTDLYNGDPWLGVTIMDTLKDISPAQACKKIAPERNSIWQIINHMISWRENVLLRVQGNQISSPNNNYITDITDTSQKAWKETLARLENSQQQWISFLQDFDKKSFDTIYAPNGMSYYEHINGILQHDAYHLGQIVLLSKLV